MSYPRSLMRFLILILIACSFSSAGVAQSLLNKPVTIEMRQKPVSEVLKAIGDQGGFYFSYNSNLFKKDSLVTIYARQKTVNEVLDMLFAGKYEYKEKNNYIIIQQASEYWYATGYVIDANTGEKIINASVYERRQLVSTLTDEEGYFKLRLKDKHIAAVLNISRSWYSDTELVINATAPNNITIGISPKNIVLDTIVVTQNSGIEKNRWSKLLLSSKQRIQSLNINKAFIDMPVQTSFTPGLSTHGSMNSQVVNKLSFNVLGGYTAGTNGFELGGLFNIVRKDVKYVQIAGLFNNVGGEVEGVQIAGLFNNILDTVHACQVAGLSNVVQGKVKGLQIGGISNAVTKEVKGMQIAGISNIAAEDMKGVQIAGISNLVRGDINGMQLSGIVNVAKNVNGMQFSLVNVADSVSGVSLGIVSLVRKGYHKVSVYTNEVLNTNVAVKLGTANLYTMFIAGMNIGTGKAYSFGIGYGSELKIWKWLRFNPEISSQHIYLGDWQHTNLLAKLYMQLNIRVNKNLAFYGGPTLNMLYKEQKIAHEGYMQDIPGKAYHPSVYTDESTTWVGWNAGITLF